MNYAEMEILLDYAGVDHFRKNGRLYYVETFTSAPAEIIDISELSLADFIHWFDF